MFEEVVLIVTLGMLFVLLIKWIQVYNTFQYLRQTAQERLSNIEVLMKQRYDMIMAVVQTAKKYNLHENQIFKDTTEARAHWDTKLPVSERVRALAGLEDNILKVNAVVEQYPDLKAVLIQNKVLETDVDIENKLSETRILYNQIIKEYNYKVNFFPLSIIAHVHHFEPYDFMQFGNQEYVPSKIYGE